jgi:hypothetical protein
MQKTGHYYWADANFIFLGGGWVSVTQTHSQARAFGDLNKNTSMPCIKSSIWPAALQKHLTKYIS